MLSVLLQLCVAVLVFFLVLLYVIPLIPNAALKIVAQLIWCLFALSWLLRFL